MAPTPQGDRSRYPADAVVSRVADEDLHRRQLAEGACRVASGCGVDPGREGGDTIGAARVLANVGQLLEQVWWKRSAHISF